MKRLVPSMDTKFCGNSEERTDMGVLEEMRGIYQVTKVEEGIQVSGHAYTKAQRPQVTWRVVTTLVHVEWWTFIDT